MELDQERYEQERPDDADRFARIWKRVVPEEDETAPVRLVVHPPEEAPAAVGPTFPLGEGSAGEGDLLRRFIVRELQSGKTYAALAGSGKGSTPLKACGADELHHARRLSAAYFLISGIRYLPAETTAGLRWPSREQGLRELFQAGQQAELDYRAAAERTADPALSTLYLELAREEAVHLSRVRLALEELL